MELIILGSSAAIPVQNRNLAAVALQYRSDIILFDCGEDVQRRFVDAGIKFNKRLTILISHFHGDHIIGLPGLMFRFGLNERTAPITIIGPRNLFLYLLVHRKVMGLNPKYPVDIVEIDDQEKKLLIFHSLEAEKPDEIKEINDNIIHDSNRFEIAYAPVDHSVLTFAYSFNEKPRYGKFNSELANKLGVPHTRIRKKLQKGESIELEGNLIDPIKEGIVGPPRPGRKVTYSADLMPCQSLIELGKNSDVLIHEATFSKALTKEAIEKKHSTSIDAANDAKLMNAKQLVLTHISSRYQEDPSVLLDEAREIFENTILGDDLTRIEIK